MSRRWRDEISRRRGEEGMRALWEEGQEGRGGENHGKDRRVLALIGPIKLVQRMEPGLTGGGRGE